LNHRPLGPEPRDDLEIHSGTLQIFRSA
jgi:hypothetical protein